METEAVLTLIRDVAAEVITPRFRALESGEIHEKGPGDLVTDADHESERLITAALQRAYPDAAVLGEEAFAGDPALIERYAAAEHSFTIDPVDGTRNFVHGSPDHAVMVAELRAGVVVRSWIWQPQHDRAYVAERGAGAFCNGERLVTSPPPSETSAWRVTTSRRRWVGHAFPETPPNELTWLCCGVDYPQLIEGAADALVYGRATPWDHAPGSLLLAEAGGVLAAPDGSAYDPRFMHTGGLVATPDATSFATLTARWSVTSEWG